ncbi:hypothetical protein WJX84_010094 [Apatococcus fuscideae]|uniref:Uncharacterized protein n=1 Tax=Apatococcus fuscideae TaxID=2026836 RepID=A0AAW1SSW7_9CHLO
MGFLSSIASGVGKLRTDYKLASSKRPQISITCSDTTRAKLIENRSLELTTLALASSLEVLAADAAPSAGCPVSLIDETTSVYMQLGEGDVDHSKELEKHLKEQEKQEERMQAVEKAGYVSQTS